MLNDEVIHLCKELDQRPTTCIKCGMDMQGVADHCYTCESTLTPEEQEAYEHMRSERMVQSLERLRAARERLEAMLLEIDDDDSTAGL